MLIDIFISFSGNIARGKSGAFDIGLGLIGLLVCFCCVILNSPKLTLEGLFLPIARDSKPLFQGLEREFKFYIWLKKKGQEISEFCTKTIHLFKCSPAQVHTEPLSSLWTLNISMGGGGAKGGRRGRARGGGQSGEWLLHLLYELVLRKKRIGHKTVMTRKKVTQECQQYHRI